MNLVDFEITLRRTKGDVELSPGDFDSVAGAFGAKLEEDGGRVFFTAYTNRGKHIVWKAAP